jgi:hypothetical protein
MSMCGLLALEYPEYTFHRTHLVITNISSSGVTSRYQRVNFVGAKLQSMTASFQLSQ